MTPEQTKYGQSETMTAPWLGDMSDEARARAVVNEVVTEDDSECHHLISEWLIMTKEAIADARRMERQRWELAVRNVLMNLQGDLNGLTRHQLVFMAETARHVLSRAAYAIEREAEHKPPIEVTTPPLPSGEGTVWISVDLKNRKAEVVSVDHIEREAGDA